MTAVNSAMATKHIPLQGRQYRWDTRGRRWSARNQARRSSLYATPSNNETITMEQLIVYARHMRKEGILTRLGGAWILQAAPAIDCWCAHPHHPHQFCRPTALPSNKTTRMTSYARAMMMPRPKPHTAPTVPPNVGRVQDTCEWTHIWCFGWCRRSVHGFTRTQTRVRHPQPSTPFST